MRSTRTLLLLLLSLAACTAWALSSIRYSVFRYTGFGVADPERDKATVATFRKWVDFEPPVQKTEPAAESSADKRVKRIAELEMELALPPGPSRAERLRFDARKSELKSLKSPQDVVPVVPVVPLVPVVTEHRPTGNDVVALVDTIPDGLEVKNGAVGTRADSTVEILGHFLVKTRSAEEQARLLKELKLFSEVAGGNLFVISFLHGAEEQGKCRGATGLVLKAPDFDPKRVTRGKLPTEI